MKQTFKGVHRVTADSQQGRRFYTQGKDFDPRSVPADIREHNRRIDEQKKAKTVMESKYV
jgi:hypothetical protein